jgi:hypothetical protein
MGNGSLSLPPCTTSATCTVFIVLEPQLHYQESSKGQEVANSMMGTFNKLSTADGTQVIKRDSQ